MHIIKTRCDHTIDFAAEELKKYLRMMMPQQGDIAIECNTGRQTGFRLGLLSDFGIPFEGKDPKFTPKQRKKEGRKRLKLIHPVVDL